MIVFKSKTWWRFRDTDRLAVTKELRVGSDVDTVVFRFVGEKRHRKSKARSFLEHFVRVP